MGNANQGIVHVIGPELGLSQPGMTIVCGDSHTSTHGAFGALAFGIGTSEVEHVLATQTLPQMRPATMAVEVDGDAPAGVTAKDIVLAIIGRIGTGGGIGHVIEYRGPAIRGAVDGGPDDGVQHVHRGRRPGRDDRPRRHDVRLPRGPARTRPTARLWERALDDWRALVTDDGADVRQDGDHRRRRRIRPHVTWGTNPAQVVPDRRRRPRPVELHRRRPSARPRHGPCSTWA